MRIAVIGTGIAGNAAAWTLSKRYPVTVYEREIRPGGHSHTINIDYDGTPVAVDIGFIVYNELNYPDLTALFSHLGVETPGKPHELCSDRRHRPLRMEGRRQRLVASDGMACLRNRETCFRRAISGTLRDIPTFNRESVHGLCRRPADGNDASLNTSASENSHRDCSRIISPQWARRSGRRRRRTCWIFQPRTS